MVSSVLARSISLRAAATLSRCRAGRVLAAFERVCDLETEGGEVVALAWGGVGNGPLNVVLDRDPGGAPPAGSRFAVGGALLRLTGGASRGLPAPDIDLSTAIPWDPRPDWDALWMQRGRIAGNASYVAAVLAGGGWRATRCGLTKAVCAAAARGDHAAIRALVGLGPGLTPAGDDWLAGWLLGLRLGQDPAGWRTASALVAESAGQTNTLSRAFLACAAAGEADARWHALLGALAAAHADALIKECTRRILSHGATSGAAMLLGFLAALRDQ